MLRIFTVEYDPLKKSFDDSALSTFLAGKRVISIEKRFFKQNSRFFWTFAIEYETDKKDGSKDIDLETDGQKGLFLALREWRNELAAEKGVPPYLLFTNNQLKQIKMIVWSSSALRCLYIYYQLLRRLDFSVSGEIECKFNFVTIKDMRIWLLGKVLQENFPNHLLLH